MAIYEQIMPISRLNFWGIQIESILVSHQRCLHSVELSVWMRSRLFHVLMFVQPHLFPCIKAPWQPDVGFQTLIFGLNETWHLTTGSSKSTDWHDFTSENATILHCLQHLILLKCNRWDLLIPEACLPPQRKGVDSTDVTRCLSYLGGFN